MSTTLSPIPRKIIQPSFVLIALLIVPFSGCMPTVEEPTPGGGSGIRFSDIPGVVSVEVNDLAGTYIIQYRQWINHFDTTAGTFLQEIQISHRGVNQSTVLHTEGYYLGDGFIFSELAELTRSNLMTVEHRYCGSSIPGGSKYEYLNVKQAAYDLHRIREAFGEYYAEPWMSTGASKGGINALCYKYYFPDDVAATVAYVAPFSIERIDSRSVDFATQIGERFSCISTMKDFQMEIMRRKADLAPMLAEELASQSGTYLGDPGLILQDIVATFPWTYWSNFNSNGCTSFPDLDDSDSRLLDFLLNKSVPYFYESSVAESFLPYYYQAHKELGTFTLDVSHLKPWWEGDVTQVSTGSYFESEFGEVEFSNEEVLAIVDYLETEAEQIIYLYGGKDFWTSGAIQPQPGLDVVHFLDPGQNHYFELWKVAERETAYQALERWTGVSVME